MGYRDVPVGTETCLGCNTAVEEGTPLCPGCGAPIDASQFAELELKLKPLARQASTALGVATILFALCFAMLASLEAPPEELMTAACGMFFFGGCCLLSARWPLAATATALAVFSALHVSIIAQGRIAVLFQGTLIVALKVILVVLLVGGVKAALRMRDIRRQARPTDRGVGVVLIAATLAAGIVLGLWVRHLEAPRYTLIASPPEGFDSMYLDPMRQ